MTRSLAVLAAALVLVPMSAAQEAPGWDQSPYAGTLSLSAGFSDDPRTLAVRPGGSVSVPVPGCVGYISSRPDVVVEYRAGGYDRLTFSAASPTDVSLIVRDPSGRYHCDDDSGAGYNPVVTTSGSVSGRYAVWVGVYSSSDGIVDGVFGVSEVGSEVAYDGPLPTARTPTTPVDDVASGIDDAARGVGQVFESAAGAVAGVARDAGRTVDEAAGELPGWNREPNYGTVSLSAGFSGDPRTVAVRAGGSRSVPDVGRGCVGRIGFAPDHVVQYRAGSYPLTVSAAGPTDLTLVVRTPSGRYLCDDDSGEGANPRIDISQPESGAYRIWVGTYADTGNTVVSTLAVSEIGAVAQ